MAINYDPYLKIKEALAYQEAGGGKPSVLAGVNELIGNVDKFSGTVEAQKRAALEALFKKAEIGKLNAEASAKNAEAASVLSPADLGLPAPTVDAGRAGRIATMDSLIRGATVEPQPFIDKTATAGVSGATSPLVQGTLEGPRAPADGVDSSALNDVGKRLQEEFAKKASEQKATQDYNRKQFTASQAKAIREKPMFPIVALSPELQAQARLAYPGKDSIPQDEVALLGKFGVNKPLPTVPNVANAGKTAEEIAFEKRTGQERAKQMIQKPQALAGLKNSIASLDRMGKAVNDLANSVSLSRATGLYGAIPSIPGSPAANIDAKLKTLKSQIGFSVLQALRDTSKTGGALGQVSDKENELMQNNIAAMDTKQSTDAFRGSLNEISSFVNGSKQRLIDAYKETYGESPFARTASDSKPDTGQRIDNNTDTMVTVIAKDGTEVRLPLKNLSEAIRRGARPK